MGYPFDLGVTQEPGWDGLLRGFNQPSNFGGPEALGLKGLEMTF